MGKKNTFGCKKDDTAKENLSIHNSGHDRLDVQCTDTETKQ